MKVRASQRSGMARMKRIGQSDSIARRVSGSVGDGDYKFGMALEGCVGLEWVGDEMEADVGV